MSFGEPHQPWHALRNAVLDGHTARDRLTMVQRERLGRFSTNELQLALHVAQTGGAAVDVAAIGYELGCRAGREGRDPDAAA